MINLSAVPAHLLVTGGFIGLLLIGFIALFLVPGIIQWFRLGRIQRALSMFKAPTPTAEMKKLFSSDRRLAHLWSEYQDTPTSPLLLKEGGRRLRHM